MKYEDKIYEFGHRAKVLIDLHIESPHIFDANKILDELIKEYTKQELQPNE